MAFAGMCPYLKNTKKADGAVCECARFTFPDKQSRRDVLYGYCGHPDAWRGCMFKLIMDRYYDRKFAQESASPKDNKILKKSKSSATGNCCETS